MKTFLILALGLFVGCYVTKPETKTKENIIVVEKPCDTLIKVDTVFSEKVLLTVGSFDTVMVENTRKIDSLTSLLRSTRQQLFISNYKLARVKYYLNICLRNPTQDKFLKGWIRRVIY